MLLRNIEISNFKNYGPSCTIKLGSTKESYHLSTVIGRNGSGKSSLFDAIEFCLFYEKKKSTRTQNLLQLINNRTNESSMTVCVEFQSSDGSENLIIKRSISKSNKLVFESVLNSNEKTKVLSQSETNSLLSSMGIDITNLDRIFIKQNSGSIACASSQALLQLVESVSGTLEYEMQVIEYRKVVDHLRSQILQKKRKISLIQNEQANIIPELHAALKFRQQQKQLNLAWINYYRDLIYNIKGQISDMLIDKAIIQKDESKNLEQIIKIQLSLTELQSENEALLKIDKVKAKILKSLQKQEEKYHIMYCDQKATLTKISKEIKRYQNKINDISHQACYIKTKINEHLSDKTNIEIKIQSLADSLHQLKLSIPIIRKRKLNENHFHNIDKLKQLYQNYNNDVKNNTNVKILLQTIEEKEKNLQIYIKRITDIEHHKQQINDTISRKQLELNSSIQTQSVLQQKCASVTNDINEYQETINQLDYEIKSQQLKCNTNQSEMSKLRKLNDCRKLINQQRNNDSKSSGILGILCDLITPINNLYEIPLLSVLGKFLTNIIIVQTREDAIFLARQLSHNNISDIIIDIIDEYSPLSSNRNSNKHSHQELQPLSNYIHYSTDTIKPIIQKRLDHWLLFHRQYSEFYSSYYSNNGNSSTLINKTKANIVALDGYKFLHDGEIQTKSNSKTSLYTHWPNQTNSNSVVINNQDYNENDPEIAAALLLRKQKLESNLKEKQNEQNEIKIKIESIQLLITTLQNEIKNNQKRRLPLLVDNNIENEEHQILQAKEHLQQYQYQSNQLQEQYESLLQECHISTKISKDQLLLLIKTEYENEQLVDALTTQKRLHINNITSLHSLQDNNKTQNTTYSNHIKKLKEKEEIEYFKFKLIENQKEMIKEEFMSTRMKYESLVNNRDIKIELEQAIYLAKNDLKKIEIIKNKLKSQLESLDHKITDLENKQQHSEMEFDKFLSAKKTIDDFFTEESYLIALSTISNKINNDTQDNEKEKEKTARTDDDQSPNNFENNLFDTTNIAKDRGVIKRTRCSHMGKESQSNRQTKNQLKSNKAQYEKNEMEDGLNTEVQFEQLKLQTSELNNHQKSVNLNVLDSNREFHNTLLLLSNDVADLLSKAAKSQKDANNLQSERFSILTLSLEKINKYLGHIYQQLVVDGDCYLSYANNAVSLFEEGITLLAQQGNQPWKETGKLSGGQQATCGLALLLSIQESFPSSLYFMDEVDAALDTRIVSRLGMLLREKAISTKAQFLLISHRPELHEYASRIIGLYILNDFPSSISHCFSQKKENRIENSDDENLDSITLA